MHQNFFLILNYHDLFRKCLFEWDLFGKTWNNPEENCYHLFNVILGLNHLFDWVVNDPSLEDGLKLACIQRFNPYSADEASKAAAYCPSYGDSTLAGKFPITNEKQRLVRQLCNRAKHSKSRPSIEYNIIWLLLKTFAGGKIRLGRRRRIHFPQYYMKDQDGDSTNLQDLCSDLIQQWGNFVRPWRLYVRKEELSHRKELPPWLISMSDETKARGHAFWFNKKGQDDAWLENENPRDAYYIPSKWYDVFWFISKGRQNAFMSLTKYELLSDLRRMKAPRFLSRVFEEVEWALLHGVTKSSL